jgi:hypothetical protein
VPTTTRPKLAVFHGRPILTGRLARRSAEQVEHVRSLERALSARGAPGLAAELRRLGARNVIARRGVPAELRAALEAQSLRVLYLPEIE